MRSFGPAEPDAIRRLRDLYWERRAWLEQLEGRIQMTDAGLAWLMRVKSIGHSRSEVRQPTVRLSHQLTV